MHCASYSTLPKSALNILAECVWVVFAHWYVFWKLLVSTFLLLKAIMNYCTVDTWQQRLSLTRRALDYSLLMPSTTSAIFHKSSLITTLHVLFFAKFLQRSEKILPTSGTDLHHLKGAILIEWSKSFRTMDSKYSCFPLWSELVVILCLSRPGFLSMVRWSLLRDCSLVSAS